MNITQQKLIKPGSPSPPQNIRITQLDVLRGLAVLGIYWINIIIFALPSGSYYLPILGEDLHLPDVLSWSFTEIFVEGTMRGLFSILFGASAMLFLSQARLEHQGINLVDRYYRRTLFLMLFGMIHGYLLLWPYDVLYAYGLLGLFLFPLRNLSPRVLIISGCLLLTSSYFTFVGNPDNQVIDAGDSTDLVEQSEKQSPVNSIISSPERDNQDKIKSIIEDNLESSHYLSNYLHILKYQWPDVTDQHSSVMYTDHFFDIGGMMLIGMALLKLGILSGQRSRRFYIYLAAGGYLLGFTLRAIGIYMQVKYDFDIFENESHAGIDYDIGRLPITLGHIGLVSLACQSAKLDFITRSLSAVGRLALTNYISQTIISIFLFYGFGFSLFNKLSQQQVMLVCCGVWIFQITFSLLWLRFFRMGPLEWLWRALIYNRFQPLRR